MLLPVPGVGREEASVEQLADALVQAAQEVHVGRASVQPLVLHQQLPECHLRLLSLLHDHQLGDSTGSGYTRSGLCFVCSHVTHPPCPLRGLGDVEVPCPARWEAPAENGGPGFPRPGLQSCTPSQGGKGRPLWPGGPGGPTLLPRPPVVQQDNSVNTACSFLLPGRGPGL